MLGPLTQSPPRILQYLGEAGAVEVTLRAVQNEDFGLFRKYTYDPAITRYDCVVKPDDGVLQGLLNRIEKSFNEQSEALPLWQWVVHDKAGEPVGFVSVCPAPHDSCTSPGPLMIGFAIDPIFQGNHYGLRASQCLIDWATRTHEVSEMQGWCHPENKASQGLMRKLGMEKTEQTIQRYFPALGTNADMEVWSRRLS